MDWLSIVGLLYDPKVISGQCHDKKACLEAPSDVESKRNRPNPFVE